MALMSAMVLLASRTHAQSTGVPLVRASVRSPVASSARELAHCAASLKVLAAPGARASVSRR